MAFDILFAGVGVVLIWKVRKMYKDSNTITVCSPKTDDKPIKQVYVYKNKSIPSVPIPIIALAEECYNMTYNTYNYSIKRSKSLPVIFEDRSLS